MTCSVAGRASSAVDEVAADEAGAADDEGPTRVGATRSRRHRDSHLVALALQRRVADQQVPETARAPRCAA